MEQPVINSTWFSSLCDNMMMISKAKTSVWLQLSLTKQGEIYRLCQLLDKPFWKQHIHYKDKRFYSKKQHLMECNK